jgi:hypothetical protein
MSTDWHGQMKVDGCVYEWTSTAGGCMLVNVYHWMRTDAWGCVGMCGGVWGCIDISYPRHGNPLPFVVGPLKIMIHLRDELFILILFD